MPDTGFPPAGVSREAHAEISVRLDEVRASGVEILLAVESGSRAWGFPSLDSDYDCRFLYARSAGDHLALEPHRDVMEFPIEGDIDVGGWDLRKALLLALGGNAVVVEWATSPIRYMEAAGFCGRLSSLLAEIVEPTRVSRHYLGLARSHIARIGSLSSDVRLKKLFYLVRPLVALDWMQERGFTQLPPMNLIECMRQTSLPTGASSAIEELIRHKKQTREMGEGPVPRALALYLESRYRHHELNIPPLARDNEASSHRRMLATAFYRREIENASRIAPA